MKQYNFLIVAFAIVSHRAIGQEMYNTINPTWNDVHRAEFESDQHRSLAHDPSHNFFEESSRADRAQIDAWNMRDEILRREKESNNRNEIDGEDYVYLDDSSSSHFESAKRSPNEIYFCDPKRFKLKYTILPKSPSSVRGVSPARQDVMKLYAFYYDQFYQASAVFETAYEKFGRNDNFAKIIKFMNSLSKDPSWNNMCSSSPSKIKAGKERLKPKIEEIIISANQILRVIKRVHSLQRR